MNIKVNNQYLDFEDSIDMERRVKLFEQSADSVGDFSYDFSIQATGKNRSIIELYSINQPDKLIYSHIPATIEKKGQPIYVGYIKVEKDRGREIDCSFFSGNSDLFALLDFSLKDFDFSTFDKDWTKTEIVNRESATDGIIYPVISTGALETRSYVNWHVDDMHPFIYVKSVIRYLFARNGLKLEGDILQDWRYNHLITSNASEGQPQAEIDSRKTSVGKTTDQSIPTTPTKVTFHLESGDYYPGDLWNTATDRYTADYKMKVDITVDVIIDAGTEAMHFYIYKNGVEYLELFTDTAVSTGLKTISDFSLEPGDYFEFFAAIEAGTGQIFSFYLTVTPVRIYRAFTSYLLPDMSARDFVSGVFSLFNPVINFNALTKVATVNLFKNVIRNEELDISEFIDAETIEHDFVELMQNYGEFNNLTYSDSTAEVAKKYNSNNVLPYGAGQIDSGNQVAGGTVEIFESQFSATGEDNKNPFKTFLPSLKWRGLSETTPRLDSVSLTNSGGLTFTASGFEVGDLVRVTNSTQTAYNGEWIVTVATSTTFRVAGLTYLNNATADIVKLEITFERSSEQALLLALPNIDLNDFTNNTIMFYADSSSVSGASSPATAYFYKPLQGLNIDDYKQSLSFGPVTINNAHQTTMISDYWLDFQNILRDPVLQQADAYLPLPIFNRLFDGPIRIKTDKFNCRFYCNRVTGYTDRALPAQIELVKI